MLGDWSVYYRCLGVLDIPEHAMTVKPQNTKMADVQRLIESYKSRQIVLLGKTWNF